MKVTNTFTAAAMAALVGLGAAPSAQAAIALYDNFGPGDSYDQGIGWTVDFNLTPANSFVAANSGSVSQIDIALSNLIAPNGATVSLWTDAAGALGSELGSWDVSGLPNFGDFGAGHLTTISAISGVSLTAGATYFLQVAPAIDVTGLPGYEVWNLNTTGATSADLLEGGAPSETNVTTGAFDILDEAVPEPATWAVMLVGLGLTGAALRSRRKLAPAAA